MVNNNNGYSFQPGLMDRMYEDKKEEKEKAEKEKNKALKKAERERKRKEKENNRKKRVTEAKKKREEKKKEWTFEDKRNYSILALIMIPLCQLFFIYQQGGWLDIVLRATKNSKYLKQWLPDGDGLPYSRGEQGSDVKCSKINAILRSKEDTAGGEASAASAPEAAPEAPQKGGRKSIGGKRTTNKFHQKGGFSRSENDKKEFFDSTKYGIPYEWADNENLMISGIGEYFKTFWQGQRGYLKFLLETTNKAFFKEHSDPTNLGEQIWDFTKFSLILPSVNIISFVGQLIASFGLLFWAAFNNQTLLIIPLFIAAICFIFLGWTSLYIWPFGLFSIYLIAFHLRPNPEKLNYFRTYGKRYKWIWSLSILAWWFVIIGGGIWKWQKDIMIMLGIVGALILLGMLGISTLI